MLLPVGVGHSGRRLRRTPTDETSARLIALALPSSGHLHVRWQGPAVAIGVHRRKKRNFELTAFIVGMACYTIETVESNT